MPAPRLVASIAILAVAGALPAVAEEVNIYSSRHYDTDDGIYSNCVYQRLTRFAPTLEVEGDAAVEWSVNAAAKSKRSGRN